MEELHFQLTHFHFKLPPKSLSFLEVGKQKPWVDKKLAEDQFRSAFKEGIKYKLKQLKEGIKRETYTYAYFSKSFLDLLSQFASSELEQLQSYVQNKQIILVGGCAFNSLSYLCSNSLFEQEVRLHLATLEKYFESQPEVFINTACIYTDDMAEILIKAGYKGAFAGANQWHLGGKESQQLFKANTQKAFGLLLVEQQANAQNGIQLVNGWSTAYDLQESNYFPQKRIRIEAEVLSNAPTYSVHLPISAGNWSFQITQYVSSGLQRTFLSECKKLIESNEAVLNEQQLEAVLCLLQPTEMIKMRSGNEQESYGQFVNSMNLLTAIQLSSSRS